jgi:hypothetical protein
LGGGFNWSNPAEDDRAVGGDDLQRRNVMSYSKKLTPEKFEELEETIQKILDLKPGMGISVSCESPEDLVRIRYKIYDFLFHMELKGKFRLRVLNPRQLVIQRLGFAAVTEAVSFGVPIPQAPGQAREFPKTMIERLIELWGEAEARAQLEAWVEAKAISKEEGEELWEHVTRIMS